MQEQLAKGLETLLREKEKREKKPTSSRYPSLEIAARQVHEQLLPGWRNPKHGKQWISTLEQYAFRFLVISLSIPFRQLHIASVLQPIWLSIPETATRVETAVTCRDGLGLGPMGFCQQILSMSWINSCRNSPAKQFRTTTSARAMDWRVLPEFYQKHLASSKSFDVSPCPAVIVIFTACRSGEARNMRWEEFDLRNAIWTIPADRMKAHYPQRYRCLFGLAVLKNRVSYGEWVFLHHVKQVPLTDMAGPAY